MKFQTTLITLIAIFSVTVAANSTSPDLPDPPRSPASHDAQRRYIAAIALANQEHKQSLITADKTRLEDLQAAWKTAALTRDTAEIQRINAAKSAAEAELEKHQAIDNPDAALAGKWKVRYASGSIRHYVFAPGGHVHFTDENRNGRLANGILDFNDGRAERITPAGDRLLVEHFNPRETFPNGIPLLGVAEKE
jgi:hypothetical protein